MRPRSTMSGARGSPASTTKAAQPEWVLTPIAASLWSGALERPVMLQVWHAPPRIRDSSRIDVRHDHAGFGPGLRQYLAPGCDDQRVTISLAAIGMRAALRRRDDESTVLDRAGPQQRVPVR